jgi:hypothetical protein
MQSDAPQHTPLPTRLPTEATFSLPAGPVCYLLMSLQQHKQRHQPQHQPQHQLVPRQVQHATEQQSTKQTLVKQQLQQQQQQQQQPSGSAPVEPAAAPSPDEPAAPRCRLYIGFTRDLCRRLKQHNGASGSRPTKRYRPWKLVLAVAGFTDDMSAMHVSPAWRRQHGVAPAALDVCSPPSPSRMICLW